MDTNNRETALKSALNRTLNFEFKEVVGNFKLFKLRNDSFYKIFIKESNLTTVIEILNGTIFSVNLTTDKSTVQTRYYKLNNGILYGKGIPDNTNISVTIDFFEDFEVDFAKSVSLAGNFFEEDNKFTSDAIFFKYPLSTRELYLDEIIDVENLNVVGTIRTEKIKFGPWTFVLDKDSGKTTCTITKEVEES